MEPEKKDPEKEPQKVANEPSLKGRAPLVKVEATVEEQAPAEPEVGPGKSKLTCGLGALFLPHCFDEAFFVFLFFFYWGLGNFTLRLSLIPFLKYNILTSRCLKIVFYLATLSKKLPGNTIPVHTGV